MKKFTALLLCAILVISLFALPKATQSRNTPVEKEELNDPEVGMGSAIDLPYEPPAIQPMVKYLGECNELIPATYKSPTTGKTIYVDDDFVDDPLHHKWNSIAEGIKDANDGDIIRVYDGIYHENSLFIDKSISLIGNGSTTTIVDGDNAEWRDIIHIVAAGVMIEGFKFINAGDDAIEVEGASLVTIRNCEFENNLAGVCGGCSLQLSIEACTFYNNTYGTYFYNVESAEVESCDISNNVYGLLYMDSDAGKIIDSTIYNNVVGLYMDHADEMEMYNVSFVGNTEYGVYGEHAEDMVVKNCEFIDNKVGFYTAHGGGSVLRNNTFNNNLYNFGNWGSKTSDFEWDIDTSNTINGKPIYYIVGEKDLVFDDTMDIGFLALISCDNITVRNVSISNNFNGIEIVDTENSHIVNCSFHDCYWTGIHLGRYSKYNKIENCAVYNIEERAIYMWIYAEHNLIANTTIHNASMGVYTFGKYNEIYNCSIYNCSDRAIGSSQVITIRNCSIWDNYWGIVINAKSGTILQNNTLWNNEKNFGFPFTTLISNYNMQIDTSNTINGKPIYYIVGEKDLVFDDTMDIGFLALISCDNITVRNVSISNNYDGIVLIDTTNSIVENCTVSYCHYGLSVAVYSENNVIRDCKAFNNSHGIFFNKASANVLKNCESYNNIYGIWLHYCPLPANVLRGNKAWNNEQNYIMRGSGIDDFRHDIDTTNSADGKAVYQVMDASGLSINGMNLGWLVLVNCSNVEISNIELSHTDQGMLLVGVTDSVIKNCIVHDTGRGISLYYDSNNNIIENCTSYNNGFGIYFYSTSDSNIVRNCNIYNNSIGLYVYRYGTNHHIENCIFHDNEEGILLYYRSNDNIISDCDFYNNGYGIDFYYKCSDNTVVNSTIIDNEIGIDIYYLDKNMNIQECNISHNSMVGIRFYKSTDSTITDNYFIRNYYAIYLYTASTDNKIYHNYFIDTATCKHVRDECGNEWDNGYPSGGNFWSDYEGKDEYKGAAQDQPGSDGIGDQPYIILSGCPTIYAQDNYPLLNRPPISYLSISATYGGYISPSTTIVIKGMDDDTSGNEYYIHYIIDGGAEKVGGLNEDITLKFNHGDHVIEYWAVDGLGFEETPHHKWAFKVDSTPPLTQIVFSPSADYIDGYYCISPETQISFNVTDIGVGVAYTAYAINGKETLYTGPFTLETGEYIIRFSSTDMVGNAESVKMVRVKVSEDLAPVTTYDFDSIPNENGWFRDDVIVKLHAEDKDGVKATYYRIDGGKWKQYTGPITIGTEGIHELEFYSVDIMGWQENIKKAIIKIDKTIPVIEIDKPLQALYIYDREIVPLSKAVIIGKLTIEARVDDNMGIDSSILYIDGKEKAEFTEEIKYVWNEFAVGIHEITITTRDIADNENTEKISIVTINFGI